MQFSIIIPTLNRCDALARTLTSLAQLDFKPDDFEIIVVDNGSTDGTPDAFEFARNATQTLSWRYISERMPGLLSGRHRGALASQGEICIFIDDDVRLDREWLSAFNDVFKDVHVSLAGGPSLPQFEITPPDWLKHFYVEGPWGLECGYLSLFDGGSSTREIDPARVWGLNYAIRREALFQLGGFHPDCIPQSLQRYQGDGESGLSAKLRAARLGCRYHPKAKVLHEVSAPRLRPEYFERRAYYQGISDSYTAIRRERQVDSLVTRLKASLRTLEGGIINMNRKRPETLPPLVERTHRAYKAGRAFHQREVSMDPQLLSWVTQDNYWNYTLPLGWEARLAGSQ